MKKRVIICAVTAAVVILAVLFKLISSDSIVNIEHRQLPTSDLDVITMKSGEIVDVTCSPHIEEFEGGVYSLDLIINGGTHDLSSNYSVRGLALDISFPQDEHVDLLSAYYRDDEHAYEVGYDRFMVSHSKEHPGAQFVSEGEYLRVFLVFRAKPTEIKATLRYNIEGKGFRLLNHFDGQQMELNID